MIEVWYFDGGPSHAVIDPTAAQRRDSGLQRRLYPTRDGVRGIPPDEWILAPLGCRGFALAAD